MLIIKEKSKLKVRKIENEDNTLVFLIKNTGDFDYDIQIKYVLGGKITLSAFYNWQDRYPNRLLKKIPIEEIDKFEKYIGDIKYKLVDCLDFISDMKLKSNKYSDRKRTEREIFSYLLNNIEQKDSLREWI